MQLFGALASPYVARVVLFARLKGIDLQPVMPEGGIKTSGFLEPGRMRCDGGIVCPVLQSVGRSSSAMQAPVDRDHCEILPWSGSVAVCHREPPGLRRVSCRTIARRSMQCWHRSCLGDAGLDERCVFHRERCSPAGAQYVSGRCDRAPSATLHDVTALSSLLLEPQLRDLPLLVLGEGSNVLLRLRALRRHDPASRLCAACASWKTAGRHARSSGPKRRCSWDPLVDWTLVAGLCGLENLRADTRATAARRRSRTSVHTAWRSPNRSSPWMPTIARPGNFAGCRTQPAHSVIATVASSANRSAGS